MLIQRDHVDVCLRYRITIPEVLDRPRKSPTAFGIAYHDCSLRANTVGVLRFLALRHKMVRRSYNGSVSPKSRPLLVSARIRGHARCHKKMVAT